MVGQTPETRILHDPMPHLDDPGSLYMHPRAVEGLRRFNAGDYFEAHEELEAAWRAEKGPVRDLYQGILQVGVACYHLERGNYRGALKVIRRGREKLEPFPDEVLGITVRQIKQDAEILEKYLMAGEWEKKPPRVHPIGILP